MSQTSDLAAKIDRLDSTEQIRQLAYKYGLAVDMRDLDAIVSLHVEDVRAKGIGQGRQALKQHFDKVLRGFTSSSHMVGNHVIEFEDPDHAIGMVYCHCEHEIGDKWIHMQMLYLDTYERRGGAWYFARQRYLGRFYATDHTEHPIGPQKVRWPGARPVDGAFHARFPAYDEFWTRRLGDEPVKAVDPARFLRTMLRDQPIPER
jgi:ketosteroid isomerase-like protein